MKDTNATQAASADAHWVFAYGSLIYKIDFPYLRRELASLDGWERRFWQGSHDHRGTPESPGRVVTLIPVKKSRCLGIAYLVEGPVFEHLDHREKNGYERRDVMLQLHENGDYPAPSPKQRTALRDPIAATVYVADSDNPAFLGGGTTHALAAHIAASHGPSGSNAEYLLKLAEALRGIGEQDGHVEQLAAALLRLGEASSA